MSNDRPRDRDRDRPATAAARRDGETTGRDDGTGGRDGGAEGRDDGTGGRDGGTEGRDGGAEEGSTRVPTRAGDGTISPYADTTAHLFDELSRLDLLLRRRLETWWKERDGTVDELRGLFVSDEEVDTLLSTVGTTREPTGVDPALATAIERRTGEIRARVRRSLADGVDLRLPTLEATFGLDPRHRDTLLLALAPALDTKYARVYAYLQDDVSRTRPTVGLLARVRDETGIGRLSARDPFTRQSPLVRHRLVRLDGSDDEPLHARTVSVDERVVAYLLGSDDVADALAGVATVTRPTAPPTLGDLLVDADVTAAVENLFDPADTSRPGLLAQFHGPDTDGMRAIVDAVCAASASTVVRVDGRRLASDGDPFERVHVACREARLQRAVLHVTAADALGAVTDETSAAGGGVEAILDVLDRHDDDVFLTARNPLAGRWNASEHELVTLAVPRPSYDLRRTLWERVDTLPDGVDPTDLASKFRLTASGVDRALAAARTLARAADEPLGAEHVYAGCRAQSGEQLDALARRIEPGYTWDDIVLPPDRLDHLRTVAAHVKHRGTVYVDWGFEARYSLGNGLVVLFAGPSGTGKTMAAEIVAGDAGLNLYKIDLSTVVSKYIGETEKNLREIFDAAEHTDAILLFDEADALFGKRTEVKDAHDRYANIEVNYLLQRIEEYDGVVVLTTNFKKNIDDAFARRIHLAVDFPLPDRDARERIWRLIFPEATPVGDLDVDFLAGVALAGGSIKNVALTAAFLAADDDSPVEMTHVVEALKREFQKTGRLITPEEFGDYREHIGD